MTNDEVLEFVKDWLEERRIKSFFKDKEENNKSYIKLYKTDLYNLCYKLVDLINDNIE